MSRIAALIPAAGASSRYGQCKQLVEVNGKGLLQHAVDSANGVAPGKVFVVTGAHHLGIAEAVHGASLIYNPHWQTGLGSSIACGVERIGADCDGILIMLADQVALCRRDLQNLCDGFNGGNIVCARYQGQRGVPALFCRESFSSLRGLKGERGAKSLLYAAHFQVAEVPMENASIDIDSPDDLRQWLSPLQRS